VKPLAKGVYWTQGGEGSNTGIIVGTDGVILLDPKETVHTAKDVLDEVRKLTDKPVTHVVITHGHGDHVMGLFGYPRGIKVFAHFNTAKTVELLWHSMREPERAHYLPTHTVDKSTSLTVHGVRIDLLHFGPAHTNGDLLIHLPDHRIVFDGGVLGSSFALENDGSSTGKIENLRRLVALKATTYVPAHSSELMTNADVQKMLDEWIARHAKVSQLFAARVPLEEAKRQMGERELEPGSLEAMFAGRKIEHIDGLQPYMPFRGMTWTERVYWELSREVK
jgi:glyoxylase-like metal-dependent hydrolase (beta-lactamase superfamily II)